MKTILKTMFLLCGAALSALAVHAQKKVIIEDESPKGVVLVTIDTVSYTHLTLPTKRIV